MNKIKDIRGANHNASLTKRSRRIHNESSERVIVGIYTAFFNDQRATNNKRLVKTIHAPFRFPASKDDADAHPRGRKKLWQIDEQIEIDGERKREKEKEENIWLAIDARLFAFNETSLFASSLLLALIIRFSSLSLFLSP